MSQPDGFEQKRNIAPVLIGAAVSVVLFSVFLRIQDRNSELLAMPVQYLIASLIPLALSLWIGGYVGKLKAGGVEISAPEGVIENAQKIPDPGLANPAIASDNSNWSAERDSEYARTEGYMLAHVYRPSDQDGQNFDVSVFLVRHRKGTPYPPSQNLSEVKKVEFFFGESWGNRVFSANGSNGIFAVRTHAWGTFLAMAKVTFKGGHAPITLFRYIDFSMSKNGEDAS